MQYWRGNTVSIDGRIPSILWRNVGNIAGWIQSILTDEYRQYLRCNTVSIDGRTPSILMVSMVHMDEWMQSMFMDEYRQYCWMSTGRIDGWIQSTLLDEYSPKWRGSAIYALQTFVIATPTSQQILAIAILFHKHVPCQSVWQLRHVSIDRHRGTFIRHLLSSLHQLLPHLWHKHWWTVSTYVFYLWDELPCMPER